jgi:hypothetical protein
MSMDIDTALYTISLSCPCVHVPCIHACREQNVLADRLASMSMDIDTALYTILRRDDRGLDALRMVARAARIMKKSVSC